MSRLYLSFYPHIHPATPPPPHPPTQQEEAIPILLSGRNVLARAKNGTGKTAAFIIPCLEKTDVSKQHIQVLMLVPTRELALQTSSIVKEIGKHMNVQCMVSTGGTTLKDDIMRLYNVVHILVSPPTHPTNHPPNPNTQHLIPTSLISSL